MTDLRLERLSDSAAAAHARIQQDFDAINPVIGISRNMRSSGFAVDVMTIDCLKTRKRIIIILDDDQPEIASYQFGFVESSSVGDLNTLEFDRLNEQLLYQWISSYFGPSA